VFTTLESAGLGFLVLLFFAALVKPCIPQIFTGSMVHFIYSSTFEAIDQLQGSFLFYFFFNLPPPTLHA